MKGRIYGNSLLRGTQEKKKRLEITALKHDFLVYICWFTAKVESELSPVRRLFYWSRRL